MKQIILLFGYILFSIISFGQIQVCGVVTDALTGEALIGATILYGKGMGTATDYEGNFSFEIQKGERSVQVSYVGYKQINKTITITNKPLTINFKLETILLNEVQVVADVARNRETPVAFSTISMKKIDEELASQDIPMVLNSTPGVYATQSGGGDGDARITIRGFNQRNVAVMIDGIPVNDMENGWVYWSNWFGLDAVTSNIQVQRGLGASKIAIPSVGGTMNILTKGTGNKTGGVIKQEVGSYGYLRTSFGFNSGKLNKGWGVTLAGSYKKGNGFVDETWSEGFFYYTKIQKELGKHIISLSAMGAPQKHGQRSYKSDIATYDTTFARLFSDDTDFSDRIVNKGIEFNKHWGYLDRWSINSSGDTTHKKETLNTKQNYYHKPQFALRDFWTVTNNLYMSNIAYASIGNGGGTAISGSSYDQNGQYNLQEIYNVNVSGPFSIDPLYSDVERKSGNYLKSSINNHYWYGLLSTMNYQLTDKISLSGGVDIRYYKGEHYREIYDLLGGDYAITEDDETQLSPIKRKGDIIGYHNDGLVKWHGIFSQVEYSNGILSGFLNISGSKSAYKRIDYFKKKDLVLADTTYRKALGSHKFFGEMLMDTIWHMGKAYTMQSNEAKNNATNWKWISGYTLKSGTNFNIDEYNNVFVNIGYISKAPRFNNVYDFENQLYKEIENEIVKALEVGYAYKKSLFSINANGYYTLWENKPADGGVTIRIDDIDFKSNINGMNALHKGLEFDFGLRLTQQLTLEGLLSLGDWIWKSGDSIVFYDENNNIGVDAFGDTVNVVFDAEEVHVGDAAQTQFGLSIRYEPINNAYFKIRGIYFDDYYADFDPLTLTEGDKGRESWKIPSYKLLDLHCGYKFKLSDKHKLDFRVSILNLLNEKYISDAQNNDPYNANYQDFDAKSAGVFFGLGRRFNMSVKFSF